MSTSSKLAITILFAGLFGITPSNKLLAQNSYSYDSPPTTQSPNRIAYEKYEGVVIPSQQVKLIAPFQGVLKEIDVKEGQKIDEGQKLALMDDRVQSFLVQVAKQQAESDATIERAKAALDEAELVYNQTNEMVTRHAASNFEEQRAKVVLEQAKADYDLALENKAQMQTQYELELERLAEYRIEAPFNGQVIRLHTEAGSTLADNEPVVSIASLDPLKVNMYLPIEVFGKLNEGKTYNLYADKPINTNLNAKLTHIDPIIDSASQTFRCVFEIQNSDYKLPAGFTVHMANLEPAPNTAQAQALQAEDVTPNTP
ncbi:efflux RND transporter periplasmic adaptor subunit [Planctomycetota bacterium]|nr:efflux RND transporter periplasmic adaptor subunit [Planctomycetota bacterium]